MASSTSSFDGSLAPSCYSERQQHQQASGSAIAPDPAGVMGTRHVEQLNPQQQSRSICLKAFVIFVIVIGAVALVTGVLALLASKGVLPSSVNSLMQLAKIGEVNSYLMICGGFSLFVLGIVAWTCHLRKEHLAELPFQRNPMDIHDG